MKTNYEIERNILKLKLELLELDHALKEALSLLFRNMK